jgi:hypothetical protein
MVSAGLPWTRFSGRVSGFVDAAIAEFVAAPVANKPVSYGENKSFAASWKIF